MVTFAGQVMLGAVTSFKVTEKAQVLVLLAWSLAVSVTVSVALCPVKPVPDAGLCVTIMAGLAEQLSLKVAGE